MNVIELPIDQVKPYAKNPRRNDAAVDAVVASLKAFSWHQPIVVDAEHVIIAGHTRWKAAKKLGLKTVPVHVADLTPEQARAYRIADNSTRDRSEWDIDLLRLELPDLPTFDFSELGLDLAGLGLSEPEPPADAEPKLDRAEELRVKWATASGQLWALGEHRLLCGDSTVKADVERVMGGEKAAACVTDPPYGVTKEKWDRLPNQTDLCLWMEFCDGPVVAFGAARPDCLLALLSLSPQCERVYVWWNTFTLTHSEGAFWQWQPIYVWRRKLLTNLDTDVIQMAANTGGGKKLHVTQKPVPLMIKLVGAAGNEGDRIYEPFAGSGTTIVACQNLSRKCRAIEISPGYTAVCLERLSVAFPDLDIHKLEAHP